MLPVHHRVFPLNRERALVVRVIQEAHNAFEVDTAVSRRLGFMAGEIDVPDDFDTMGGEELIGLFQGDDG